MPKRDWTAALEKVQAEGRCRACGRPGSDYVPLDAAHIIPRSRVTHGGEHSDNICVLCRTCHALFDGRKLDLLPYLTRMEQAKAVELHPGGLLGAVERLTGERFAPVQSFDQDAAA